MSRVHLGTDLDTGEPVWLDLEAIFHVLGPGASRLGKTHDQELLAYYARVLRWATLTVDPKADPGYARRQLAASRAAGQGFHLFSLRPFGDPTLDPLRESFAILADGSPTQAKDAFVFSQRWESPHFLSVVERGVQTALAAQHAAGLVPDLRRTGRLLRDPGRLATALGELDRERFAEEIGWLQSPAADEISGLRGAANRCAKMIEGDGGDVLLPRPKLRRLDLVRALRDRDHVHFAVDVQAYPQLGPEILSHFIAALVVATGRLRAEEFRVEGLATIDEAGVLEGGQGRDLLERCGDVGVRTAWAPQSMSAIEERCGRAMRDALTENCNVVIAHRQSVQDAAQLLAAIAGTDEQLEHSHVVRDAVGPLGFDEPGLRTRRLAEAFRSHPNRIKQLQAREVLLIEKDERLRVRFVRVRDIPPLDGDYIARLRRRIGLE